MKNFPFFPNQKGLFFLCPNQNRLLESENRFFLGRKEVILSCLKKKADGYSLVEER